MYHLVLNCENTSTVFKLLNSKGIIISCGKYVCESIYLGQKKKQKDVTRRISFPLYGNNKRIVS